MAHNRVLVLADTFTNKGDGKWQDVGRERSTKEGGNRGRDWA